MSDNATDAIYTGDDASLELSRGRAEHNAANNWPSLTLLDRLTTRALCSILDYVFVVVAFLFFLLSRICFPIETLESDGVIILRFLYYIMAWWGQ